jgi:hypothetical protein
VKPTDEQLERLMDVADANYCVNDGQVAMAFWDAIAPMVLEEAAKVCDRVAMEYERRHQEHGALLCRDRIRALKGEP